MPTNRPTTGVRKKFSKPPVKLACLACRSSRTRCEGGNPCESCRKKGHECVFTQSHRGGSRVHHSIKSARIQRSESSDLSRSDAGESIPNDTFHRDIPSMVAPGAGLTRLEDIADTGILNDSVSWQNNATQPPAQYPSPSEDRQFKSGVIVRWYSTNNDILEAYYIWIHPFFPILPAPTSTATQDGSSSVFSEVALQKARESRNKSPLFLAISAVMALIAPSSDHDHASEAHVVARRRVAQELARQAIESIEHDSELAESVISPECALSNAKHNSAREQFHDKVPTELENIIALCLLSVYEYSQRGNLSKMRDRAGQALMSAMHLSLHCQGNEVDEFTEARRRTWWMAYVQVCQASIVSSTPPIISVRDSRFTTRYPTVKSKPEAWPFFIESQRIILSATQFVVDLNQALERKSNNDIFFISERMLELDGIIKHCGIESDQQSQKWLAPRLNDEAERDVALSLLTMSRIKLNSARIKVHRYCAFLNIPAFTEKHCDLDNKMPVSAPTSDQQSRTSSSCGCCSILPESASPFSRDSTSPSSMSSAPTSVSAASQTNFPTSSSSPSPDLGFPFTSNESSRICLQSALNIAEAFDELPHPSPPRHTCDTLLQIPRTMPSFACCAMQGSYALLMVYHRAWIMKEVSGQSGQPDSLMAQCEHNLRSIFTALDNYSLSFEAIRGMRNQVEVAINCLNQ